MQKRFQHVARKDKVCDVCGRRISKGNDYVRYVELGEMGGDNPSVSSADSFSAAASVRDSSDSPLDCHSLLSRTSCPLCTRGPMETVMHLHCDAVWDVYLNHIADICEEVDIDDWIQEEVCAKCSKDFQFDCDALNCEHVLNALLPETVRAAALESLKKEV